MFGDKKLVLVRGGGGQVARAAGDYLAAPTKTALLTFVALRPDSNSPSDQVTVRRLLIQRSTKRLLLFRIRVVQDSNLNNR